ncbi:MAG: ATP-binding cassette domain-containing protein, partial [Caulobacterales bacterium]|uniref:ATP-binding cassette domain-containing protein n=1 Tax=Glycocaulis sp. TaxID=1969725 RepID=UPI003FA01D78
MADAAAPAPGNSTVYHPVNTDKPVKVATNGVDVFYSEKQALHGISVNIHDRSVTAFIGPSGCGKSTFLRCINRMNDTIDTARVSGSIRIDDEEINDRGVDPVLLRARVGMVF